MEQPDETILQLLTEQYQAVEEYANAQTALYNALHSKKPAHRGGGGSGFRGPASLHSTHDFAALLRSYSDAVTRVQSSTHQLQERSSSPTMLTLDRGRRRVVDQHRERMSIILNSMGGQPLVHPNGIPANKTLGPDDFLIALSATRASIRVVQTALDAMNTPGKS